MLTVETVDMLRGIAEELRSRQGDEVYYGGFRGGDPNNFSPDPECSTEEERAAHAEACKRWDAGECDFLPDSCLMSRATFGKDAKFNSFGLGMVTMRRGDVDELADELDRWIDKAREVGDRYR